MAKKIPEWMRILPVVDLSGSMTGTPMQVAKGLGYLVALAQMLLEGNEYGGKVVTFSSSSLLCKFHEDIFPKSGCASDEISIGTIADWMGKRDWGFSTNFEEAMELTLHMLEREPPELARSLRRVLLVLTDMSFDQAMGSQYETTFEVIERRFQEKGVGMPLIVLWNIRGDVAYGDMLPTEVDKKNVVYLSGYSADLLKDFLDMLRQGEFKPATGDAEEPFIEPPKLDDFSTEDFFVRMLNSDMYRAFVHPNCP